ncbi:hypothetical protein [Niabella hibiscisoli]|uniref:hypothetical protein n=1 Tax=Niabella hibiscisoli TaxID=1825928 RepID=UPI001F110441|nr:hypothetical protein [Niabella hibiscisoli]MCH5719403.1 hypothetical protein [Niabella hibiscisoli]
MKYSFSLAPCEMYRSDEDIKADARRWVVNKIAYLMEEVKVEKGKLKCKIDVDRFLVEIELCNVSADLCERIVSRVGEPVIDVAA